MITYTEAAGSSSSHIGQFEWREEYSRADSSSSTEPCFPFGASSEKHLFKELFTLFIRSILSISVGYMWQFLLHLLLVYNTVDDSLCVCIFHFSSQMNSNIEGSCFKVVAYSIHIWTVFTSCYMASQTGYCSSFWALTCFRCRRFNLKTVLSEGPNIIQPAFRTLTL